MANALRMLADAIENVADVHLFRRRTGSFWPEGNFERTLHRYLNTDCIFDVGANIGQFAKNIRTNVGYDGLIVSFEPNPTAFRKLRQEAEADPLWHCYETALGSSPGSARLNVMKADNLSSILPPGGESDRYMSHANQVVDVVEVEVKTVDSVFKDLERRFSFSCPFLKLDTQGFDLEVIRGAADSMQLFTGCVTEVSMIPLYDGQPSAFETIAELREHRFELVDLFNVHPGGWFQPLIECNAYFLRQSLAQPREVSAGYPEIHY